MSGQVHGFIGFIVSGILGAGYLLYTTGTVDAKILVPLTFGAIVGSLMVDIDSKKSKASTYFTRIIVLIVWIFCLSNILVRYSGVLGDRINISPELIERGTAMVDGGATFVLTKLYAYVTGSTAMTVMAVIVTLGKVSPHRQFTHKWFGTLLFCGIALIAFRPVFSYGFVIGYVLHLLADSTTSMGIDFFKFRLPCMNRNNEFRFHM